MQKRSEQWEDDREKKREARDNGRAEAKGGGTGHRWSQVAVSHRWLLVIDGCQSQVAVTGNSHKSLASNFKSLVTMANNSNQ